MMSTVYVVIGQLGTTSDTDTMQVFLSYDAAKAYGVSLLARRADSYEIIETTVR